MARRRTREETREYLRRLCRIIAADRRPVAVLTAAEEADRALSHALIAIRNGAADGYMAGRRLDDYRRVEAIAANLGMARAFGVTDLDARTVDAVTAAETIAETWRGREE